MKSRIFGMRLLCLSVLLALSIITVTTPTSSVQAATPYGRTGISSFLGFDACNAPSVSQMQTWYSNSPLYDVGIYIGGSNRGCKQQTYLSASWVSQIDDQGWGIIPTYVGLQAPL